MMASSDRIIHSKTGRKTEKGTSDETVVLMIAGRVYGRGDDIKFADSGRLFLFPLLLYLFSIGHDMKHDLVDRRLAEGELREN